MSYRTAPLPARMVVWASRHNGIVGLADLRAAGVTDSTITGWLRDGRVFRIHRGVYSTVHPSLLTDEGRWFAAVRACRGRAALSHRPAAACFRCIDRTGITSAEVSVTDRRRLAIPGVVVHRPRRLEPVDLTTYHGIPITCPTRTVWDLASVLPERSARRAFEKVDGRQSLNRGRMRQLLDASPNRKGAGLIRELLGNPPLPLHMVRSWLEELILHVCSEHRLPVPEPGVELLGYEVDFLWENARFIVEADGDDHLGGAQRDRDNDRDFVHGRAGYLTRRYTYKAMAREREVAGELRSTLIERLRRP